MRIAVFQSDTAGLIPADRLNRLREKARDADCDLLLCPELFMSGYAIAEDNHRFAESADGEFALGVATIAKSTGTAIVYGYPEMGNGVIYNSAQAIDSHGRRVINHRKLMLPPGHEKAIFTHGTGLSLFEVNNILFALLICYDAEFPEAVRAVARAGAQVVLVPTALVDDYRIVADKLMPARAFENGVYLVYANHAGIEGYKRYLGASCIVGPDGIDLARAADREAVITADIDPHCVTAAQQKLPYLGEAEMLGERLR